MESQIYHLFFVILLYCHHVQSQRDETAKVKPCRNMFSDTRCTGWKEFCEGNDFLRNQCAKTCSACQGSPVNGSYSQWSDWSPCSRSCAEGNQQRFRTCTNPSPTNRGTDCKRLGPDKESRKCFIRRCPVDGGFSKWSSWFPCSKSCNGGTRYRFRSCTNPTRAHGGTNCRKLGRATESQSCNTHRCPVHGGYSRWSSWDECSSSCNGGTQARNRSCTNPRPAYGGRNCSKLGNATEQQRCNIKSCPVHGGYSRWHSWDRCSRSCGRGLQYLYRNCNNPRPAHGGRDCRRLGPRYKYQTCNTQKCPGHFRKRPWERVVEELNTSFVTATILGRHTEGKAGRGLDQLKKAEVVTHRNVPVNFYSAVHGGYSTWHTSSACSRSCGGGTQLVDRFCNNPRPAHGGQDCRALGPNRKTQSCNTQRCPVDGGFSPWSSWSVCSMSCDGGTQARNRSCTNPRPAHGGRNCNKLGNATERRGCNAQSCPVHGGYSQWSDWSPCSRSCDGGSSRRFRSCTSPPPSNGGGNCTTLGQALESMKCNTQKCPVCKNLLDDGYCIKWSKFCSSHPTFLQDCEKACGLC